MDEESFIEDIQSHPELYDKQNRHYMDVNKKEQIWSKISEKYNVENAKKKWTSIRERYVRERKKIIQLSGSRSINQRPSELFHTLSFLDVHLKPRTKKGKTMNGQTPVCISLDVTEDIENENEDYNWIYSKANGSVTGTMKSDMSSGSVDPLSHPNCNNTAADDMDDFSEVLQTQKCAQEEEDMHFLKSISYKMKKMNEVENDKFKILMLQSAIRAVANSNT